ncbi:MAG: hypothetical protein JXA57_02255 [Armatimonadetes bacterium]|nr:hypothetical protein [Armatimonadota bacterium]
MKKSVSPAVAIAIIVVVVIVAAVLFSRAAKTSKRQMIPGVGQIDPETGQPVQSGAQSRRGQGGGRRGG